MSFDRKKDAGLPATVLSAETMLGVIETLGIVPFFENPIPGYSIEEMTARENWFDGQEDLRLTPWDWNVIGSFLFNRREDGLGIFFFRLTGLQSLNYIILEIRGLIRNGF